MKKYFYLFLALFLPSVALANPEDCVVVSNTGPVQGHPGVLVKCIPNNASFYQYFDLVLSENQAYIIAVAVIVVVFSGLQYMLAFGTAAEQTKAKQRIIGVVTGIVFFTLIRLILSILTPSLTN